MRYADWMEIADGEYRRLLELLRTLEPADWRAPTDCVGWDVHAVVAHLSGAAASAASPRETVRQARMGERSQEGNAMVDRMNAVQVGERAHLAPEELVSDLERTAARGMRARRRLPGLIRAVPMPFGEPLGTRPLGYLMGRIYTRDAWMHRVDLARATGRELLLTPDHDGRIVADVVEEWADRHGQPFTLTLIGPAGGTFSRGVGGPVTESDAVEFCRALSGRAAGGGLLAHPVPF